MADGEWWRRRGPWSEPSGGGDGAGGGTGDGAGGAGAAGGSGGPANEDSVYATGAPVVPPRPSAPPAPPRSGRPAGPEDQGSPWVAESFRDAPADPDALPSPQLYASSDAGGWDLVMLNFSDGPGAAITPIPEQRAEGGEAAAAAGPPAEPDPAEGKDKGKGKNKDKDKGASRAGAGGRARGRGKTPPQPEPAAAPPKPSAMAGRRPSPLLLLASVTLVGGAVSGQIVVMLVGWALGYMSRQLSDLTRKFAILGIPLATISGTSLWYWGRAQGRWGGGLQPGQPAGEIAWSAAPGVLRLAAVLSALFLLGMALKKRVQPEG
ncbi:hypothetical protein ACIF6L_26130 [Kitasatospora sp. NPDC086009]|uniref:hypothetical protein n=1 Tax=unclassified Kitasatospora TaxID=2633591 RepID=UPI0037C67338